MNTMNLLMLLLPPWRLTKNHLNQIPILTQNFTKSMKINLRGRALQFNPWTISLKGKLTCFFLLGSLVQSYTSAYALDTSMVAPPAAEESPAESAE